MSSTVDISLNQHGGSPARLRPMLDVEYNGDTWKITSIDPVAGEVHIGNKSGGKTLTYQDVMDHMIVDPSALLAQTSAPATVTASSLPASGGVVKWTVPTYIDPPAAQRAAPSSGCDCGADTTNSLLAAAVPENCVRHVDYCRKYKPLFAGGK